MSDLDNAINSINASAVKAENTATFLDDMSTFDDQSSVTNPNNGQTVASIPKQVKDRTDELFTAAESDINQAVADAEQSATDAQDAADSIGRYQGLWPDSGGIADKGDTYQTQVSGTPTGLYFTALQNTTVDPVGDDVNWRAVISATSLQTYEAASVADMIAGISQFGVIALEIGQRWSSGAGSWEYTGEDYNGFKALGTIFCEDFDVDYSGASPNELLLSDIFQLGGVIDVGSSGVVGISDEVRVPITKSTTLVTRGALIKYIGPQVADDVKTLIHLTGNGTQVVQTDLIIDGGLVTQNNFIPVALTVNGALFWRENSKVSNAAAAANPVNIGAYISDNGVVYKNMIQTTAASSFEGTYGYGFVAVNVAYGQVNGGVFGTKDEPIHRHAIYISTNNDGSGNCGPFTINSPTIEQLRYSDNSIEPITEFEYCIKSISSESVTINGAIVNGGNGFILLTTRAGTTRGTVTYANCIVRTGQRGVALFAEDDDETDHAPWSRVEGSSSNVIVLTSAFASAMRLQMVSSVIDYSTYIIENTTETASAYNAEQVTSTNPISALFIYSVIHDFQRVFSGGNVNNMDVDVKYVNPDQTEYPFGYTGAVGSKNIMIRFPSGSCKYYKMAGNAGLSDIKYYEEDFQRVISNLDPITPLWEDESGRLVSGQLANRPSFVPRQHPYWEADQNRFVYWTGSTWWTSSLTYPEVATTSEILAVSDNILGDGASIYNTTNRKPYWYDDNANQWKDGADGVLS